MRNQIPLYLVRSRANITKSQVVERPFGVRSDGFSCACLSRPRRAMEQNYHALALSFHQVNLIPIKLVL